jgi:hypothetical protein
MRKLLLAVAALFFMAGLVVAAEVTLVKYDKDKKEVTVKDDKDKEHTYKITDKTKFTLTTKDGDKEAKYEDVEPRLTAERKGKGGGGGKGGGRKVDITTEGDAVTQLKVRAGRTKN